jgi:hypothetical protein
MHMPVCLQIFTDVFLMNTTLRTASVVWKLISMNAYSSFGGRNRRKTGRDKATFRVSIGTFKSELKILFESLSCTEIGYSIFKFIVSISLKLIGCSLEFLYLTCLLLKGWAPMQQVSFC